MQTTQFNLPEYQDHFEYNGQDYQNLYFQHGDDLINKKNKKMDFQLKSQNYLKQVQEQPAQNERQTTHLQQNNEISPEYKSTENQLMKDQNYEQKENLMFDQSDEQEISLWRMIGQPEICEHQYESPSRNPTPQFSLFDQNNDYIDTSRNDLLFSQYQNNLPYYTQNENGQTNYCQIHGQPESYEQQCGPQSINHQTPYLVQNNGQINTQKNDEMPIRIPYSLPNQSQHMNGQIKSQKFNGQPENYESQYEFQYRHEQNPYSEQNNSQIGIQRNDQMLNKSQSQFPQQMYQLCNQISSENHSEQDKQKMDQKNCQKDDQIPDLSHSDVSLEEYNENYEKSSSLLKDTNPQTEKDKEREKRSHLKYIPQLLCIEFGCLPKDENDKSFSCHFQQQIVQLQVTNKMKRGEGQQSERLQSVEMNFNSCSEYLLQKHHIIFKNYEKEVKQRIKSIYKKIEKQTNNDKYNNKSNEKMQKSLDDYKEELKKKITERKKTEKKPQQEKPIRKKHNSKFYVKKQKK